MFKITSNYITVQQSIFYSMMLGVAMMSPYSLSGGILQQTIPSAKIKSRTRNFESNKEQVKLTLQTWGMSQVDSLAQKHKFSYQSPHRKALWLVPHGHELVCTIKPKGHGELSNAENKPSTHIARLSSFGFTSHLIVPSELHKIFCY